MIVDPIKIQKESQTKQVLKVLSHISRTKIMLNALRSDIESVEDIKYYTFGISAKVRSSNGINVYNTTINNRGKGLCDCIYYKRTGRQCKHIFLLGMKYISL